MEETGEERVTSCDQCSEPVDMDIVAQCESCGRDGLCPDCLNDHDCEGEE